VGRVSLANKVLMATRDHKGRMEKIIFLAQYRVISEFKVSLVFKVIVVCKVVMDNRDFREEPDSRGIRGGLEIKG
jgi:hypothetical protein